MEYCAQMHVPVFRGERVGEYPFGVFALILGGQPADAVKIVPSGFTAICRDGKGQLYIFDVSGGNVCPCRLDSFDKTV